MCKRCKFSEKNIYNSSRDIEFFLGDYYFLARCMIYITYIQVVRIGYTPCPEKRVHIILGITSSNIIRFSKFFHCHCDRLHFQEIVTVKV